ncbi:MAG: hypothetical protein R2681_18140 [Pyrinomonadaceae bacterium]
MKIHELSFGKFVEIADNIIEIIVYEGTELTVEMLKEADSLVFSKIPGQIGLLVNKLNEYTYTFEAQMFLGSFAGVKATAFITYTKLSTQTTEAVSGLPRNEEFNHAIFDNRKDAIKWLKAELNGT